jgi:centrin-1
VLLNCIAPPVDAELLEMIERADTDADGEINPDEFYAIMTKKTFT